MSRRLKLMSQLAKVAGNRVFQRTETPKSLLRPLSTNELCNKFSTSSIHNKKNERSRSFQPLSSIYPIRNVVTSQKISVSGTDNNQGLIMDEPKLLTKEERQEFISVFPDIIRDLTENPELRDMQETNRWLARVLNYNVTNGKKNRGLALALAYRYLATELTDENARLSYILGWCVEILQAFFLVADDIMDCSETRRGRPCWYKVDNLGAAAFNDAILLESSIYPLLKKHFKGTPYYGDILEIFHEVTFKTIYGQSLDTRTGFERKLDTYTMEHYSAIVKYKTSYYSFFLPISLALTMAGINDPDILRQTRSLTLEMGHFFQVQDDYLDCFGNEEITGKVGTDIADAKCSWLFVLALQKANAEEKAILKENYGIQNPDKIARVKDLYVKIGLREAYSDYEDQTYNMISNHIDQLNPKLPKQLFLDMLHKIYRRSR